MSENPSTCPKCRGQMIQGFIVDYTYGGRFVAQWAEGQPLKSLWLGTKLTEEELMPVGAYRCMGCGFLEFFARPDFAAR